MSVWRAREAETAATYGSARWANQPDIRGAGLAGADGVILGRFEGQYLRHDGPEHVLCFAPTRSGKGVGLVVPTLLTWPGSCIVHDIKGENWTLTSGFRAQHGRVLLFDPTNSGSAAYNPLLEVRRGEWEVRDVQNVADVLVDPEGSLERRNHWEKTSHALAGRSHPSRSLCGAGQDACRCREFSVRSETADRDHASRNDDHAAPRRSRDTSGDRFRGEGVAEQERERTIRRAFDRDVFPRPLSRPRRRQGDAPLRLAHPRSR